MSYVDDLRKEYQSLKQGNTSATPTNNTTTSVATSNPTIEALRQEYKQLTTPAPEPITHSHAQASQVNHNQMAQTQQNIQAIQQQEEQKRKEAEMTPKSLQDVKSNVDMYLYAKANNIKTTIKSLEEAQEMDRKQNYIKRNPTLDVMTKDSFVNEQAYNEAKDKGIVDKVNYTASSAGRYDTQKGKEEAQEELKNYNTNGENATKILEYKKEYEKAKEDYNLKNISKYGNLYRQTTKDYVKNNKDNKLDVDLTAKGEELTRIGNELRTAYARYESLGTSTPEDIETKNKAAQEVNRIREEYLKSVDEYNNMQLYDELINNNIAKDSAKTFGTNVLGGTASAIEGGYVYGSKLAGNDATTINADSLLRYNNNDTTNAGDNVKGFLNTLSKTQLGTAALTNATGILENPNDAFAHLERLYKANPENVKLGILYNNIKNHTYTGSAEDLKKDLEEAQKENLANFQAKYTGDEAKAVAEQAAHNTRAYKDAAWIPNAFGTVGNMVPSILTGVATGGIAPGLQQVGSMTALGLGAADTSLNQALQEGASYNQALGYGALKGATEVGTEMLGGETVNKALGMTGKSLLGKSFSKAIDSLNLESTVGKIIAKTASDIAGEATEEMISEAVDPLWKQITYDQKTFENMDWGNYFSGIIKAGLEAIPSTLLMQGGGYAMNNFKTNQIEQGIIDSIKNSKNLTPVAKQELTKEVQQAAKQVRQGLSDSVEEAYIDRTLNNPNVDYNSAFRANEHRLDISQPTTPSTEVNNISAGTNNISTNANKLSADVDLFNLRDFKDVGKKNTKAYQYENPEVKPFFKLEAEHMLGDLQDTIKGERQWQTGDGVGDGYGAESYYKVSGIKRSTADDIANLLDGNYDGPKMSYDQIEKGLKGIIEDEGKENNAASKRLEMVIDNRLRNGYTDTNGLSYEKNQNYLDFLDGKQSTDPREYRYLLDKQAYERNYDLTLDDIKNEYNSLNLTQNVSNNDNIMPENEQNNKNSKPKTLDESLEYYKNQGYEVDKDTVQAMKRIEKQRGLKIILDDSFDGNGIYDEKNGTIYLNPASKKAVEFILTHELGHDLKAKNPNDYAQLQNIVRKHFSTLEGYEEAKNALDNTYRAKLGEGTYNIDDEATNDILGEALGNQEFLNDFLQENPNLFQKVWNWIKNVLLDGDKTGLTFEERRILNKMQQGFRKAYQKTFDNTQLETKTQRSLSSEYDFSNVKKQEYTYAEIEDNGSAGYHNLDNLFERRIRNAELRNVENSKILKEQGVSEDVIDILETITRMRHAIHSSDSLFNSESAENFEQSEFLNSINNKLSELGLPQMDLPNIEDIPSDIDVYELGEDYEATYENFFREREKINKAIEKWLEAFDEKFGTQYKPTGKTRLYSLSEDTAPKNDTKSRLKKLNDNLDLTWQTRDSLYDRREELERQYNETINSEDYKNAFEQVKAFDNAEDAMNSDAYKKLVEAQRIKDSIRDLQDEIDIATTDMRRMQEEINNLENEDRTPEKAIKKAKKIFGTTTNFKEAGYILQDGKMLDFSGRKQGNTTSGRRALDHRQINEVGYDMDEFIGLGNIRLQPEGNGFQLMVEPTDQQYKILEKYVNQANGEIFIDIYKEGKMAASDSAEYKKNTPTSKIIDDLRQYFKTGKFPAKSQYADFLYSKQNTSWQQFLDKNISKLNRGKKTNFKDNNLFSLSSEQQQEITDYVDNQLYKDSTLPEEYKDKIAQKIISIGNYDDFQQILKEVKDYKEKQYGGISSANEQKTNKNIEKEAQILNMEEPPEVPEGKKRRWTKTAKKNELVREFLDVKDMTYEPVSNKRTLDYAQNSINSVGYEDAVKLIENKIKTNDSVNEKDLAMSELLIQEAIANGDYQTAQDLIADTAIMGTQLGRAVQALSLIAKMTPEGQLRYINKVVNRMNEQIDNKNQKKADNKKTEQIKIEPELAQEVLKAQDEVELQNAVDNVLQHIADQMKASPSEKIAEWRYLAMLANPRTHIRNIVANIGMRGTYETKNAVQRIIETLASSKLDERTRTFKKASEDVKKFAKQSTIDNASRLAGEDASIEGRLKEMRKVFKTAPIEKLRKLNSNLLSMEDNVFTQNAYRMNLQEYLTANGLKTQKDIDLNPEIVQKGIKFATEEAWKTTFHQMSKAANAISKLENINGFSKLIVGGTIPFKKTPINIAKTGASYSPLGLLETLSAETYKLKTGRITANEYIDRLSQGLTGTALFGVGCLLSNLGILKAGTDKDEEYEENIGKTKEYSIRVGNKNYDISWFSPSAMPMLMGAELVETLQGKEMNFGDLAETLASTINPLSEMSFVSGLNDTIKSYSNSDSPVDALGSATESAVKSYFGQFIPTIGGQINKIIDDTQRTTTASKNSKWRTGENFARQQLNKIPGASFLLEPKTDVWGEEVKRDSNPLVRTFDALINPGTVTEDKSTETDEKLLSLYKETGEKKVTPSIPKNYFTSNNYKYEMSAKEYTDFKKNYGKKAKEEVENVLKSNEYKEADNEDKIKMIEDAYSVAQQYAREEYGITPEKLVNKYGEEEATNRILDKNLREKFDKVDESIPLVDFYNAYNAQKGVESDKDSNGNTITYSKSRKQKEAVDKAVGEDLTAEQKELLYGIFNISKKVW